MTNHTKPRPISTHVANTHTWVKSLSLAGIDSKNPNQKLTKAFKSMLISQAVAVLSNPKELRPLWWLVAIATPTWIRYKMDQQNGVMPERSKSRAVTHHQVVRMQRSLFSMMDLSPRANLRRATFYTQGQSRGPP
jgi:hypothetical protein